MVIASPKFHFLDDFFSAYPHQKNAKKTISNQDKDRIKGFLQVVSLVLREPQHTPGAYPRLLDPKYEGGLYKVLVEGLGYIQGVCWKIPRRLICTMFVPIVATSAAEKVPVLVEWIAPNKNVSQDV